MSVRVCVHVCNRSGGVRRDGSAKGVAVGEVMRLQSPLRGLGAHGPAWMVRQEDSLWR